MLLIVPHFLSSVECDHFLKEIACMIPKIPDATLSEENSWLMRFGKVFAPAYASSKRKLYHGDVIDEFLPSVRNMYYHDMPKKISSLLEKDVYALPLRGSLNCTVLIYNEEGENMGWHVDSTLYNGFPVYTCLICLENHSTQQLCVENFSSSSDNNTPDHYQCHDYKKGYLYVFEQFQTKHAILPSLRKGDRRVMVSMTLATVPYYTTVHGYVWDTMKYVSNTVNAPIRLAVDKKIILGLFITCIILFILLILLILFLILFRKKKKRVHER